MVETEAGRAEAATVVIATNLPILDRGGYFARVSPARSYGLAYRTERPLVDGMFLSTDSPSRSLRTARHDGQDLLLLGGNGHPTGRSASPRARLDDLRAWAHDNLGVLDETHAWSAQDYVPHHGLPYAGPLLPGRDDILFAGGYSKWGMTNGVAGALVLAGHIVGTTAGHRVESSLSGPRRSVAGRQGRSPASRGRCAPTPWSGCG